MNLQHVAPGLMQPRNHDDLGACHKPVEGRDRERTYFKPGVGGTLRTLFGCSRARIEGCGYGYGYSFGHGEKGFSVAIAASGAGRGRAFCLTIC